MEDIIVTKDFITNRINIPYYLFLKNRNDSMSRLLSNIVKYKINNIFGENNFTKLSKSIRLLNSIESYNYPLPTIKINIENQYIDDNDIINNFIVSLRKKSKVFVRDPSMVFDTSNINSISRRIFSRLITCNSLLMMDNRLCSPSSIKCIYGRDLNDFIIKNPMEYMNQLGYHIQYVPQLEKDEVIFYITSENVEKAYNGWYLFKWSDKYTIKHIGANISVYRTKFSVTEE